MREPRYTTHPMVIAGVVALTSFALFSALFIGFMGLSAYAWREPSLLEYITAPRVFGAATISILITGVFWLVVPE